MQGKSKTKYFAMIYSNYLQVSIGILLLSSFSTKYFVENFLIKCTTKGKMIQCYLKPRECRRQDSSFSKDSLFPNPKWARSQYPSTKSIGKGQML